MKSISYDIDPGGDVELILKKPNKQNIVPESPTFHGNPVDPESPKPPCLGRYQVFSELYPDGENENPDVEVRVRVSSRHLTFASRTFRAMIEGTWKEGNSSSRPIRQISAENWDAFALAIVLDSIHGRHHEIPTQITDGLLTRIATIVDYCECRQAMHFNYEVWAHGKTLPSKLCNAALLWLHVSWVFHDENRFRIAARLFVRFSIGAYDFETHGLPVSGVLVSEALDSLEQHMIDEDGCDYFKDPDCTAIVLGILVRERHMITNLDPPLDAPFDGCSLHKILRRISRFRTPMLPHNDLDQPHEKDDDEEEHPCTIQGRLMPVLKEIEKAVDDVRLAALQS
ncbi:hypothetical protein FOC4_g10014214 [Fusarium odoratissimum]|uniref:BTB domain-containing protein n=1 Tax=Fusarium oxysporum f. sp. cubense (strain race 4) TaxID=2502994 RepID=N1R7W2_FUSC4|nr:hypothetical protein FOC4_g10014214 [Fusarium odoratissimum]